MEQFLLLLSVLVMTVVHTRHDNIIATPPTTGTETLHENTIKGHLLILRTKGDMPIAYTASTEPSRSCTTPATFHPCHSRQWMHPWKDCEDGIRRVILSPTHTSAPGQDTKRAESDNEATKHPKDL